MRHLAILYTNNKPSTAILDKVIGCFVKMIRYPNLPLETFGVIVSEKPVTISENDDRVINIIPDQNTLNKGHLTIINNILAGIKAVPSDFVSLHEHDVLYPEHYLEYVQSILLDYGSEIDYLAYSNLLGVNRSGYQQRTVKDFPLSILSFPAAKLSELLDAKSKEYVSNGGYCYLEPGYMGSYGTHFQGVELNNSGEMPAIHINTDRSSTNHHFTDHFLTYEPVSRSGFDQWPGDVSYLFE